MRPYVYIALNMKHNINKTKSLEVEALYRGCTWDDFNKLTRFGITDDLNIGPKHSFSSDRLCPSMETVNQGAVVKNFYSDIIDRKSFSIEIRKCTPDDNIICKSDSEINEMLKNLYFTMYTI
jgi:hypothetical protein